MRMGILNTCLVFTLMAFSSATLAQSDSYFSTGEDLDFLIESDNTLAVREIEYELRQFQTYRNIEDFVQTLTDHYIDESEE